MTDRELLELAAKAAGYPWPYEVSLGQMWSPLTDDGDALRLAVKLHLSVMLGAPGVEKPVVQVSAEDGGDDCIAFAMESLSPDPCAATRRAITRVAAEIARSLS